MRVYYLKEDLTKGHYTFSIEKEDGFLFKEELINHINSILARIGLKMSKEDEKLIVFAEIQNYDFYAVQGECDGFGNDTYTVRCFRTYQEALSYVREHKEEKYEIVGQWWDKDYRDYWSD